MIKKHAARLLYAVKAGPSTLIRICPPALILFSTLGALPIIFKFWIEELPVSEPSILNKLAWLIASPSGVICPSSLTTSLKVSADNL